jgi:hypothetical protein
MDWDQAPAGFFNGEFPLFKTDFPCFVPAGGSAVYTGPQDENAKAKEEKKPYPPETVFRSHGEIPP